LVLVVLEQYSPARKVFKVMMVQILCSALYLRLVAVVVALQVLGVEPLVCAQVVMVVPVVVTLVMTNKLVLVELVSVVKVTLVALTALFLHLILVPVVVGLVR
jgi:hypothetical protein